MLATRSHRAAACITAVLSVLLLAPTDAGAQYEEPPSAAYEGVVGFGSVVCTLVYAPVKVVYAILGSVVGGLALLVTFDTETASSIVTPAVGGDYVVAPENLEGRVPLRFIGGS